MPEEGIRRIVLVPSVVARPRLYLLDHEDTKWICAPVADECLATDPLTPPARLVRMLRALGDGRLRIMRLLATGSFSLGQLAPQCGLGKMLMHHHLTVPRGVGLVLVRSGNPNVYTLRYDTLAQVTPLLNVLLALPARKDPSDGASS